ncbi:MAG: hypothetical protein LC721_09620 [Actinobacteria bacterium]|nr:hypothetical protein [Actinomycetota bacterium]
MDVAVLPVALVALLIPVGRLAEAHGPQAAASVRVRNVHRRVSGLRVGPVAGGADQRPESSKASERPAGGQQRRLAHHQHAHGWLRAALGFQRAAQTSGSLGSTVGGLLGSTLGWRWVFDVNALVGVVAVAAGAYLLPRTHHRTATPRWNRSGLVLLSTATTAELLRMSATSGLRDAIMAM